MKILFITNIPSPYRVNFFNELGKLCQLTVLFERGFSRERDHSWKKYRIEHFDAKFLPGIPYGEAGAFCPGILKYLKKGKYDHIILSDFTSPTGMLAISWLRIRRIPYWLESDGGFAKSGAGFKEKLKRHYIAGAAGYFSTAEAHDQYYLQYGAKVNQLHRYPFTSLYEKDILQEPITDKQKQSIQKELGITESRVLLSVGQFIPRKGFDLLISAMAQLPKDIGCYIVGGQPTEEYLQQVAEHRLDNVHFVGFCQKDKLNQYYLAADLFVLPTREDIWGLVINEAMAKGLPVVTTDRCIAGLALIQDPAEGRIIPANDANALSAAIEDVLHAGQTDATRILDRIRKYTIEEMARKHMEILQPKSSE